MSILVLAEISDKKYKKSTFQSVTYAHKIGGDITVLSVGDVDNAGEVGHYGASKVLHLGGDYPFDTIVYATAVIEAMSACGATTVILSHSSVGKSLGGFIAAKLGAGLVSGAISVAEKDGDALVVKKSVFSGKAISTVKITSASKVITLAANTFPPEKVGDADASIEEFSPSLPAAKVTVISQDLVTGTVPLPEAELVVSAGRGMKGPENWGIIEDLAASIGATTACSRPVSDDDWRPHHEHVGQTGVAIKPNLYIAIGISGAIQHLAGVNKSKTIVVINKDPEAPFFKAADYGIVGDLFDVVPKLTEAIKKHKGA